MQCNTNMHHMTQSAKGAQVAFRLPSEMHDQLRQAADQHRLSVGEEIRRRLEDSFSGAPKLSDGKSQEALEAIAWLLRAHTEMKSQGVWHEDAQSFANARSAVARVLAELGPEGDPREPNEVAANSLAEVALIMARGGW